MSFIINDDEYKNRISKMAAETILVSLADIRRWSDMKKPKCKKDICLNVVRTRYKNMALKWFNERSDGPFGYGWCLVLTGYNPNQIRKLINQYLEKKIKWTIVD